MRRAVLVLLACSLSASCAFVVHGRSQEITVISDPPGARVYVGNRLVGPTPTQVGLLRSRADLVLRIEKDAYEARGGAPEEIRERLDRRRRCDGGAQWHVRRSGARLAV